MLVGVLMCPVEKEFHTYLQVWTCFTDTYLFTSSDDNMEQNRDKYVINKGYFSSAFLFKPRGGLRPPRGLNRKPRKNRLFSL